METLSKNMQIGNVNMLISKEQGNLHGENIMLGNQQLSGKISRTLNHWTNILNFMLDDKSVIFVPISLDNLDNVQLIDVVEKIIQVKLIKDLNAICFLPNKSFIYVKFKSQYAALEFSKRANMINGKTIYYIPKKDNEKNISIMVDKVPPDTVRRFFPENLQKFGTVLKIQPTLIHLKDLDPIETMPVMIDFKLNEVTNRSDLPHFLVIEAVKIYLLIKGRPNVCFHCDSMEHKASECLFKFCSMCKKMKLPNHICEDSFASKLKASLHRIGSLIDLGQQEPIIDFSNDAQESLDLQGNEENVLRNISQKFQEVIDSKVVFSAEKSLLNDLDEEHKDVGKGIQKKLVNNESQKTESIKSNKSTKSKIMNLKEQSKPSKKSKKDSEDLNKCYLLRSESKSFIKESNEEDMEIDNNSKLMDSSINYFCEEGSL